MSPEKQGSKKSIVEEQNYKWKETYANIEQYIEGIRNSESWKVL